MSRLAEEIAEKYGLPTEDTPMVWNEEQRLVPKWPHVVQQRSVLAALNEMKERCAKEAEAMIGQPLSHDDAMANRPVPAIVAARIRSL